MTALGRWLSTLAVGSLALLAVAAPAGAAQSGHLDGSFGKKGKLTLSAKLLGPDGKSPTGAFAPSDGPFLGSLGAGLETQLLPLSKGRFLLARGFRIFRFEADGGLDRRFGKGGYVTIPRPAGEEFAPRGIALDPSGRILIAAEATTIGATADPTPGGGTAGFYEKGAPPVRAAVLRLLSDGRPDPGFGNGGFVESTFGAAPPTYQGHPYATPVAQGIAIASDPDGRPVLTGRFVTEATICYPFSYLNFATRSFVAVLGTGGNVESVSTDPVATSAHYGVAVLPVPGGGTLFEGWQGNECVRGGPIGNETVAVALLASSGVAKPGFYPEALTFSAPPSPAVDGRGRAVLVGHVNQPSLGPGRFAMRLRANGTVDTHFGDEGWAELPSGGGLGRVATDTDNRPVISGGLTLGNDGWGGFSLTRLTAKGRRDAKFGGGTTTRIFFRASEAGTPGSVMVDEEGRILVAGSLTYPGSSGAEAVGVVRYVPKG